MRWPAGNYNFPHPPTDMSETLFLILKSREQSENAQPHQHLVAKCDIIVTSPTTTKKSATKTFRSCLGSCGQQQRDRKWVRLINAGGGWGSVYVSWWLRRRGGSIHGDTSIFISSIGAGLFGAVCSGYTGLRPVHETDTGTSRLIRKSFTELISFKISELSIDCGKLTHKTSET